MLAVETHPLRTMRRAHAGWLHIAMNHECHVVSAFETFACIPAPATLTGNLSCIKAATPYPLTA